MKRLKIIATMLGLISTSSFAAGPEEIACFDVQGMTCASCEVTLKAAVKKLKGINSVQASVAEKSAKVVFDPIQTNKDEIKKKIDSIGYSATNKECKS